MNSMQNLPAILMVQDHGLQLDLKIKLEEDLQLEEVVGEAEVMQVEASSPLRAMDLEEGIMS